ncbi:phage tail tube protein [Hoeflea sp.]|uniref:phage tail tube protein n=1 Tax=Hoeflea sp. TaxID=1940281 RepID=UPI0019945491|nr:phage tail tube protein [Hoeflea sp.]MBC7282573.1 hypothetical protein [Hoeflea sp.]
MPTSGFNGRNLVIAWETVTIAGVRNKTMNISNEMVDITSDDDAGWQTFLAVPGKRGATWSISGVHSDETLLAAMMAANASIASGTVLVNLPSSLSTPGTMSGEGVITSMELTGEHDGVFEFTVEIASSGAITYTASA